MPVLLETFRRFSRLRQAASAESRRCTQFFCAGAHGPKAFAPSRFSSVWGSLEEGLPDVVSLGKPGEQIQHPKIPKESQTAVLMLIDSFGNSGTTVRHGPAPAPHRPPPHVRCPFLRASLGGVRRGPGEEGLWMGGGGGCSMDTLPVEARTSFSAAPSSHKQRPKTPTHR